MQKKVFPSEMGRVPMDLMERRHQADYKPQSVPPKIAKLVYERAERFLSVIEEALKEKL